MSRAHARSLRAKILPTALIAIVLHSPAASVASTVLTFDVAGGAVNFAPVPEDYGDRVSESPQSGHFYGFVDDGLGFTPDVRVDYGAPDELPRLFTTGYGDRTNVYFNDRDSDTTLTLTLASDPGSRAVLLAFDLASFSALGQTVPGLAILDGRGTTLFSQGATFVPGSLSGGHSTVDLGPDGIEGSTLTLVIDLTDLGMRSDNVAIDNVVFAQVVPEPGTALLVGLGLGMLAPRTRSRARAGYRLDSEQWGAEADDRDLGRSPCRSSRR